MKTDKWYRDRLNAYFNSHYGKYEYDAEWYIDTEPNVWRFYIPVFNEIITLICDEDGRVREEVENAKH